MINSSIFLKLNKNRLESSKIPISVKMPKIAMRMHEKCMKERTKLEKEGQKGLTGFQGQKPYKKFEGKRQKLEWWSLEPMRRERKARKSLNSDFEKVQFSFF